MKTIFNEEKLLDIWNAKDDGPDDPVEVSENLLSLHRSMGVGEKKWKPRHILLQCLGAAALLSAIIIGEYFLVLNNNKPVETVTIASAEDSKGRFTLPDGSHVWLNSSTRLTYDASSPRRVSVEGEAFFDVVKNGEPFIVSTDEFSVKVLGTRFNVRNNDTFGTDEVSLLSGKVELNSGGQTLILSPGEKALFKSGCLVKQECDVTVDASWTGNELVFENTPLDEILTSLEHWYNVNIQISSGVSLRSRYSFKIRNESLEEAITIVGRLSRSKFKQFDKTHIVITK